MKPAELKPLIGKKVMVYWNGLRSGTVKSVPSSDVLSVQFLFPHGRHKVGLETVQSVVWYGKERKVTDFLEHHGKGETK